MNLKKTINHCRDKYTPQNKDMKQLIIIIIISKPNDSIKVLQQGLKWQPCQSCVL
jgi:hypothetical protein